MRLLALTCLLWLGGCASPGGDDPRAAGSHSPPVPAAKASERSTDAPPSVDPSAASTDALLSANPSAASTDAPPSTDPSAASTDAPPIEATATMPLPWTAAFDPPRELDTARMHLEPLAPEHTELDYAALMGSREHLQRTLRWGEWPRADFTADENREDLERHWQEFVDREGYAYTVQSPDRTTCLGCVYLVPFPGGAPDVAMLAYWVVEPELASELDAHLLESLLAWFERDWPFRRVVVAETDGNPRGRQLARDAGMLPADEEFAGLLSQRADMAGFVWERDG